MSRLVKQDISVLVPASGGWDDKRNIIQNKCFSSNKTIVDYIVSTLSRNRFKDIHVSTGYRRSYSTTRQSINYHYNSEFKTTNAVYSLNLLLGHAKNKNVLIINGDTYFDKLALKDFDFSCSQLLYSNEGYIGMKDPGILMDEHSMLQSIMWGLFNKWCQMFFVCERDFPLFKEIVSNPASQNLYLLEVINKLADKIRIKCIPTSRVIFDIDDNKNFSLAKEYINGNM